MIKSFVCVCGLLVSLNVVAASLKPVKGKVFIRYAHRDSSCGWAAGGGSLGLYPLIVQFFLETITEFPVVL